MSSLTYNGVTIANPCQVLSYTKEPVYDGEGKTLLWQRHAIRVRGVVNPKALSFRRLNVPGPSAAAPDQLPAITERAVRLRLQTPRQTLIYSVEGNEVLSSPAFQNGQNGVRFPCDSANGPVPTLHAIYPNHGQKSFLVDFGVETYVNDCVLETVHPSPLLSWRWEERHSIDQDFHSVRMIQGRAVFDQGRLQALPRIRGRAVTADDFRAWLFGGHPLPVNFHRQSVDVTQNDAGNLVSYAVYDRETSLNVIPEGVTRVEAFETNSLSMPGEGVFFQAADHAGGAIFNPWGGVGAGGVGNAVGLVKGMDKAGPAGIADAIGRAWSQTVGHIRTALGNAVATLPVTQSAIVVRAWGHRSATRKLLETTCFNIIAARWGLPVGGPLQPPWDLPPAAYEMGVTYDLVGKFVEARATRVRGPVSNLLFGWSSLPSHPTTDETVGFPPRAFAPAASPLARAAAAIVRLRAGQGALQPAPPLPGFGPTKLLANVSTPTAGRDFPQLDAGSRGTFLSEMVAQALQQPCEAPVQPGPPELADDRDPNLPNERFGNNPNNPRARPGNLAGQAILR